jgi:lipoprotein-anchoring transpeptidase ErfK/SrfK
MRKTILGYVSSVALFALTTGPAAPLDATQIQEARWNEAQAAEDRVDPAVIRLQVLLDRARFSPGIIDGRMGENVRKAVEAYAGAHELNADGEASAAVLRKLAADTDRPVMQEYKLTESDVKGPFLESIPAQMEKMKDLPALSYTSVIEKVAEQFHMSEDLLKRLNPDADFSAGSKLFVPNVKRGSLDKVKRVEVDKSAQMLKAFGRSDDLLAVYPVTVGSEERPAPSGELKITGIAKNPTYRYTPELNFKGVKAQEPFTIQPGPNNPVGLVWIGLSKEGYGIHGTPEPAKVSKSYSHGCIRLTNWDALDLATAVEKGIVVTFVE